MCVVSLVLQVADIGHCALPLHVHKEWVKRLEAEFFAQVRFGLPEIRSCIILPLHGVFDISVTSVVVDLQETSLIWLPACVSSAG
jgi:hypothetical protein